MVEIGVQSGGSTVLWPAYFGKGLKYYGLDINKNCKQFEKFDAEKGIWVAVLEANQESIESLTSITKQIPDAPDIILDDGGHVMNQQINTFKVFWPWLKNGGVYCCEDTHTSYMASHKGQYKNPSTFVEYMKDFLDIVHLSHITPKPALENADMYHSTIRTITIADSMFCLEKGVVEPFDRVYGGDYRIPYFRK
jgi:cephalosporin hydroxylase